MWRLPIVALLLSFQSLAQTNTSARQIELAGSVLPFRNYLGLHIQMGVSFPARKAGWCNTISVASTTQDYTVRGGGSMVHFHTLCIGKNYQLMRKRFYFSAGIGTGLYYTDWQYSNRATRNFGLCIVPRLEIGWNMEKVVLVVGEYAAFGLGVYQKYEDGEIYHNGSGFLDRFHFGSIGTPYVKVILK